jgi:hypothetical protein
VLITVSTRRRRGATRITVPEKGTSVSSLFIFLLFSLRKTATVSGFLAPGPFYLFSFSLRRRILVVFWSHHYGQRSSRGLFSPVFITFFLRVAASFSLFVGRSANIVLSSVLISYLSFFRSFRLLPYPTVPFCEAVSRLIF